MFRYYILTFVLSLGLNVSANCPTSFSSFFSSLNRAIENKDTLKLKEMLFDWNCIDSTMSFFPMYALLNDKITGDFSSSSNYWKKVHPDSINSMVLSKPEQFNELFVHADSFYSRCESLNSIIQHQPEHIYFFEGGRARILLVKDDSACIRLLFWENLDTL